MTNVPETGALNPVNFSGAGFWYILCHAKPGAINEKSSKTMFFVFIEQTNVTDSVQRGEAREIRFC